jgi:hypothetical protein
MLLSGRGLHGRCLKRLWRSGMAAIVAWPACGSPPGALQAWAAWLRFWGRALIPSAASHRGTAQCGSTAQAGSSA